jgi:medium-chain acyl-[acyl-carrier-protein] hydrolase
MQAWQADAAASFRLRLFKGDHFYLNPQRAALLEDLRSTLAPWLAGTAGRGLPA